MTTPTAYATIDDPCLLHGHSFLPAAASDAAALRTSAAGSMSARPADPWSRTVRGKSTGTAADAYPASGPTAHATSATGLAYRTLTATTLAIVSTSSRRYCTGHTCVDATRPAPVGAKPCLHD